MKIRKLLSLLFVSTIVVALAMPLSAQAQEAAKGQTFAGEIMDSACAKMGSHKMMMEKEGAKDAKECTDKCVQGGSKYVLYNSATKKTYQLDDQNKSKELSGQKVKITGSYDRKTKTIHVESIDAAS
jgi:hypothetical protein